MNTPYHSSLLFRQLFESDSCTYTYLLADVPSKEGIIIDPVIETVERDLKDIQELGIQLKYSLDTHVHADHITGADKIREVTGAQTVIGKHSGVDCADLYLDHGDTLTFGNFTLKGFYTPGHTEGCMSYYVDGMVFTGDALFVRGCGRTDFQSGSSERLFQSVHKNLFSLPDQTLVFPAHDYRGHTVSTIGEEKAFNPRLNKKMTKKEFMEIMDNLKLAQPQKIMEALPANIACGKVTPG